MESSWILVGMMGAGKSAIGRALAEVTGREFIDTDQLIQNRLGRPIPQIFQIYGEPTFRDHETSVLKSLEPGMSVVSTGGGLVGREENWYELRRLGTVCYLRASHTTLTTRLAVSKKKRPLLQNDTWEDDLRRLMEKRAPLYERADLVVDVDQDGLDEGLERVLRAFVEGLR
ncbi:shikimate kinase [bacterium]|nr:MAG: shikimate kinase [bacterium]